MRYKPPDKPKSHHHKMNDLRRNILSRWRMSVDMERDYVFAPWWGCSL